MALVGPAAGAGRAGAVRMLAAALGALRGSGPLPGFVPVRRLARQVGTNLRRGAIREAGQPFIPAAFAMVERYLAGKNRHACMCTISLDSSPLRQYMYCYSIA